MDNEIVKIPLVIRDGNGIHTLFDSESGVSYTVPLYQRAFAWGTDPSSNRENEIVQLMDDIYDSAQGGNYYLGSLIVARKTSHYEVIDGQQRLTALFLLFNCLGLKVENGDSFRYACREKSNYAIHRIEDLINDESRLERPYEKSIYEGIQTIKKKIDIERKRDSNYDETMLKAFQHVFLFRICVPQGTDLNRYFEVMNTRGEQLEQHDIVKAKLMSPLSEKERSLFSEVWNACRDMSGYVQMHFCKERRETLFQNDWAGLPDIRAVATDSRKVAASSEYLSVSDVISPTFNIQIADGEMDNGGRIRFESIIGFTHFLLHVLKVFIADTCLIPKNADTPLVGELLDDKKLIVSFENVRKNGIVGGYVLSDHDFSWKFLDCLLKCRFLFDKYIIKREYKEENSDGEWSLKELKKSGSKKHETAYYVSTEFREPYEREHTFAPRKEKNLMMQACLRVSYTSPKVMHWITRLLLWLYEDGCSNTTKLSHYLDVSEEIAVEETGVFLSDSNALNSGVNTPHIVLNFLDYLLWRDCCDGKGEPFIFEFRNSVEHWYPQHPSDGMFAPMDHVDRFGNLCLIQSKTNAKFSNLSPESKKSSFKDMIAKGSLKLRIMSAMTTTAEEWRTRQCDDHQNAMTRVLRDAISTAPKINQSNKRSPNDLPADKWVNILLHNTGVLLEVYSRICQWEKFSGNDWLNLLIKYPNFADKCDWTKLTDEDRNSLLSDHPEFEDKCAKRAEVVEGERAGMNDQPRLSDMPMEQQEQVRTRNVKLIPLIRTTLREFISSPPDYKWLVDELKQNARVENADPTWLDAQMTFKRDLCTDYPDYNGYISETITFDSPAILTLITVHSHVILNGKVLDMEWDDALRKLGEILHKPMLDFAPNITDKQPQHPENNNRVKTNPFFESFVNYCTTNRKLTGNWIRRVTDNWADYVWMNENGVEICFTADLRTQIQSVRLWTKVFRNSPLIDWARKLIKNLDQDLRTQGIGSASVGGDTDPKIHVKSTVQLSQESDQSFAVLVECHRKLLEFIETVRKSSKQDGEAL